MSEEAPAPSSMEAKAQAPAATAEQEALNRAITPPEQRTGSIEAQRPNSRLSNKVSRSMIIDDEEHEYEESLNRLTSGGGGGGLPPSPPRRRMRGASPSSSPIPRRPRQISQISRSFSKDYQQQPKSPMGDNSCARACAGWAQVLLIGLPLLALIAFCLNWIFNHESEAVCTRIAMDVMHAQVKEPGCVFDRRYDNLLVHMTCRLHFNGAVDPGTGLRGAGQRMIVRSEMMQYRARRFYYTNQGDYCYCYEKVWDTNYIHLDPDIRWSPKLCRWRGVNTGGQCLSSWPGANPSFTINGTDSRTSLGTFEVFDHDVRLGEEGLRVPRRCSSRSTAT